MIKRCKVIVSLLLAIAVSFSCIPTSSASSSTQDENIESTISEQNAQKLCTSSNADKGVEVSQQSEKTEEQIASHDEIEMSMYKDKSKASSAVFDQKEPEYLDGVKTCSFPSTPRNCKRDSAACKRIRLPSFSLKKSADSGDTESQVSIISTEKRRSCFSFISSELTVPEHILKSPYGIIEDPVKKRDIQLSVCAPASIENTPGKFNIVVKLNSHLEQKLDDISVYVQFSDDATEFSFEPPIPIIQDVELLDLDQYSYSINVQRINEDVSRAFFVYVTHKKADIQGEKREYLIAAHRQQINLRKSAPNKAVIIVPGICGSELFSAKAQRIEDTQYSKGYRIWPPEGVAEAMNNGVSCCIPCGKKEAKYVQRLLSDLSLIFCRDDGTSKAKIMKSNPILDCKENPDRRNFGTINCYAGLVNSIVNSEYAKNSKVVFFSYDWRISNAKTAKELEKFINDQEYSEVVLVAHSMGGLVCSSLLTNPEICKKVSKAVFLGTPFLGAAKAFNALENGVFFDGIIGDLTAPIANPAIASLTKNCASVYELLPPRQFFEIYKGAACRGTTVDRGYIFTRRSKTNPLKSNYVLRNFDETTSIIEGREWSTRTRKFLQKAQRFHDSLYNADGSIKLLNCGVPIFNITGYNMETHSGYFVSEKSRNRVSCKEELCNGDGTVPLVSSTIMGNIPNLNSYYVKDASHMALMQTPKCLELINNIISGYEERFDPRVIEKRYPRDFEDDSCCGCLQMCICL